MNQRPRFTAMFCWCFLLVSTVGVLLAGPLGAQDVRSGVEQLALQITKEAPQGRQLRVAVADFPDLQNVTSDLGRYIASRLTTRLTQSPKFFVIERQRLGQVLAELRFSISDLVDPAKVKQLGRMAGVEAIIVGTVADVGNQFDLDARMIEIETNRSIFGAIVTIAKDPAVAEMDKRGRVAAAPPIGGGGAKAHPNEPFRPKTATSEWFKMELIAIERVDDVLRATFLFTTTGRIPGFYGTVGLDARNTNVNYAVDNLGNRYRGVDSSMKEGFAAPAGVALRHWVTFERPVDGASEINLFLGPGAGGGFGPSNVSFRGVQMPR